MAQPQGHDAKACVIVIFGGSGDLTRRKVVPALYGLAHEGLLPRPTVVLGFGRTDFTDDAYRRHLRENVAEFSRVSPFDEEAWQSLVQRVFYQRGDYSDAASVQALCDRVEELDARFCVGGGRMIYLAVPPQLTPGLLAAMDAAGLLRRRLGEQEAQDGYIRVVMEKPFGVGLASARSLNVALEQKLDESQVFRMDHYLAKETVQNIIVLRFANAIFEPIWNYRHVKRVRVTVAETAGVANRANYFDNTGALRDVMQNHVLQLLALFTMEPPVSLSPDSIRDEKAKLLRCLRTAKGEDLTCSIVRGQYGPGTIGDSAVPGYRQENGVPPDSATETFVALRTYIDNWRWAGVPFYLTTGKRLAQRTAEVAVEFREVPNVLFGAMREVQLETNLLRIRVQPDEGVSLRICTKVPGLGMEIRPAEMDFPYGSIFSAASPEAYERLLLDVMSGNATLFARRDEIELAWLFVEPILEHWATEPPPAFPNYPAGSWGPIHGRDFFRENVCYARVPPRGLSPDGSES